MGIQYRQGGAALFDGCDVELMERERVHNRIAYLTVTIPVDLAADTPLARRDWWEKAALANFIDHPAICEAHPDVTGMYVDGIKFEEQPDTDV